MDELRPNSQRGKIALAQLWLVLFLNVIIFFLKLVPSVITELANMDIYIGDNPDYIYSISSHISQYIGLVYLAILIVSITTFIRWFRRAYYNLGILSNECKYSDSWAAKGWFIPIMNLYIPFLLMKELYEKTNNYLLEKQILLESYESYGDRLNVNIVKWWWFLAIVIFTIYCFQFLIMTFAFEHGLDITRNTFYFLMRTGLLITSGIITISIIKNYQKAEKLLFETEEKEDSSIEKAL